MKKKNLAISISFEIALSATIFLFIIILISRDWWEMIYLPIIYVFFKLLVYFSVEKKLYSIVNRATSKKYGRIYSGIFRELEELIGGYKTIIEKERDDFKDYYSRFNTIFNNINFGIVFINNDMRIESINKKFDEYFHFIKVKPGMLFFDVLKQANIKFPLITGRYEVYSKKMRRNFNISVNKKENYIIIIFDDITDIKKMKRSLELSKNFSRMGEIIGDISHGLKTPVARVKMAYQMYSMFRDKESFETLGKEIDNLNSFTKNTIELFKEENIKMKLEEIDLEEFIKNLENEYKKNYTNIHFEFVTKEKKLKANKLLFSSFFKNLLQNSIDSIHEKYVIKRFNPKIKILIKKKKDKIKILFYDNGKGMDKYTIENYLKPYYTTKKSGSGMGSIFIEKFIVMYNGSIEIKSVLEKMTLIKVEIAG